MISRKWCLRAFLVVLAVALVAIGQRTFSGVLDAEAFQPQQALAADRGEGSPDESAAWQGIKLWNNKGVGRSSRGSLNVLAIAAIIYVVLASAVLPRTWRTTDASLERIAQAESQKTAFGLLADRWYFIPNDMPVAEFVSQRCDKEGDEYFQKLSENRKYDHNNS